MTQPLRNPFARTISRRGLVFIILLTLLASPALAQLTTDRIEALQQQAVDESWTFEVGENGATQYPLEELCGLEEPEDWRQDARFVSFSDKDPIRLPDRFDWREFGGTTSIKNQGGCGSCWAFGTVGPLECNILIQDGIEVDLSEQWLVSCVNGSGCDGGWFAHEYHRYNTDACDSSGAVLESDYPYTASDAPCACPVPHPYTLDDWAYIDDQGGIPSQYDIKAAIYQYGPVGVAVAVDGAFQGYNGGVFNSCSATDINHAVVLVGWDDTLGQDGCWIMRNSWGPSWGEDGYMYIQYGCDRIGYGANFVEYTGGVTFESDVQTGWAPVEVSFSGQSGYDVTEWSWEFGDGATGSGQTVSHTFTEPGTFTVGLYATIGDTLVRYREQRNCVIALGDTLTSIATGGKCRETIQVPINLRNSAPVNYMEIPIVYDGPVELSLDSFSTAGCRTDYFDIAEYIHNDNNNSRVTIKLVASTDYSEPFLPTGSGPVLDLFFSVAEQESYGQETPITMSGYLSHAPVCAWPLLQWTPESTAGSVKLMVLRGDCDGNSSLTVSDLTYLVDYLFKGGEPPVPVEAGDVNCTGECSINDVTYIVEYFFRGGPEPMDCL